MTSTMASWCRGFLVLGVWLLATSCQGNGEPSAGSESHFLDECLSTCGSGFECLCGVCTQACGTDDTCTPLFPTAECVTLADRPAASACPDTAASAFCDVRCATDGDCSALGANFTCQAGFCRQGAGPDPSGLFPNGRIEVDQLCTFYARHVCRAKLQCFAWDYRDVDDCAVSQECAGWDLFNRELGAGTVTYDPVKAYACHERLEQDPCNLGLQLSVPSLTEALQACGALTGNASAGQACTNGAECSNNLICDRTVACPGTCSSDSVSHPLGSVPLGDACTSTICIDLDDDPSNDVKRCEQCVIGATCYKDACRPDWQVGEACADAGACWPNLWCDTTLGKCVPRAEAGEACDGSGFKAARCVDGYFCDAPNLTIGKCVAFSAAGGPCVDQYSCLDPKHTRCIPSEDPAALGTCGPPVGAGSPCRLVGDCTTAFCAPDRHCAEPAVGAACVDHCGKAFECVNKLCVNKRYTGDACAATDQCEASRCEASVCTTRAHLGQGCAVADDCISGRCTAGVCTDSAECAPM